MSKDALKRNLLAEIKRLPEDALPKVFTLVAKLKAKRNTSKLPRKPKKTPDPAHNPLRGLIGIADVAPFAHQIDEELYGRKE